ncbi:MAG: hypothetical protein J6S69_09835 [Proteobacteria bacterium]|nr:hypothetical protein [Pseudomonadota bacterium]
MKFGASIRNRHFVARMDKGEDFIETLKAFLIRERVKTCVFSGHGEFSKCALQAFNPDCRMMETIFSTDSFVSVPVIEGNITSMGTEIIVQASCVLTYRACGQLHTVAGLIQHARVFSAELHLVTFDDLRVNRSFDTMTGQVPMTHFKSSYDEYGGNISSLGAGADFSSLGDSFLGASSIPASQSQIPNPEIVRRRSRTATESMSESSALSVQDAAEQSAVPKRRTRKSMDTSSALETKDSKTGNENLGEFAEDKALKKSNPISDTGASTAGRRIKASAAKGTKEAEEESTLLRKGDWLRHPSLGLCIVENILPGNCVQIRPEGGSARDISLSYFKTVQTADYRGCRCYELERI